MKDLKSIIQYECVTSFKYIWFFYAIQFAMIGFICLLLGLIMGNFENVAVNGLEFDSLVYVCILGVLGYNEDFKMLIQNGFTRKYIFIATLSMFCFISGTMAIVDTAAGQFLHHFYSNYSSLYGALYGYGNPFMNWLWLFLLYIVISCLMYFISLSMNKLGKNLSIYLIVILGGILLLVFALFRFVLTGEMIQKILMFLIGAMGFMADGTINLINPAFTLLILSSFFAIASYAVIRHTEVK